MTSLGPNLVLGVVLAYVRKRVAGPTMIFQVRDTRCWQGNIDGPGHTLINTVEVPHNWSKGVLNGSYFMDEWVKTALLAWSDWYYWCTRYWLTHGQA